ncbi:hypothetical protein EON66_00110 [archaeon]|nr:MAG: hypothetical protein EON66_00110 [archaeon]
MMELATENATALEAIETAICCVSLERHNPTTLEERASDCLLGSGLNRWYDKPFTIVAYPNGLTGLNGEHTWADAMVVVRQQDFAMRGALEELRTNGVPRRAPASPAYAPPVELRFQVDAKLMKYIEQASMHIGELTFSIELRVLQFKHFGRNAVKRYASRTLCTAPYPLAYTLHTCTFSSWHIVRLLHVPLQVRHYTGLFHANGDSVGTLAPPQGVCCYV